MARRLLRLEVALEEAEAGHRWRHLAVAKAEAEEDQRKHWVVV